MAYSSGQFAWLPIDWYNHGNNKPRRSARLAEPDARDRIFGRIHHVLDVRNTSCDSNAGRYVGTSDLLYNNLGSRRYRSVCGWYVRYSINIEGMTIKDRYKLFVEWFDNRMPDATTELHYTNPYQLLVAVILSAQCTDKRINQVTPALFAAYPTAESLAAASQEEIYEFIKSVSYPNNKAKSLLGMARRLTEEFNGEVPSDIDSLLTLPGVGRKTANVILSVVFGKAAMAVDTHVFRVSERIGLTTDSKTPLQTEQTLMKYLPADKVARAHHWLILHGRYVCKARRPDCLNCAITAICRYYHTNG